VEEAGGCYEEGGAVGGWGGWCGRGRGWGSGRGWRRGAWVVEEEEEESIAGRRDEAGRVSEASQIGRGEGARTGGTYTSVKQAQATPTCAMPSRAAKH